MTTEPSNGSASDDQRCYIERLQRIETALDRIIKAHPCKTIRANGSDCLTLGWQPAWQCPTCIAKAALEANR